MCVSNHDWETFPGKPWLRERDAKMRKGTSLKETSSVSSTWHSRINFRFSEWGLQLLPKQLHTQTSSLLCHLCNTKHTTLGHTLAILWLTHPCKTFAAIIGLRHKGQSPSSLPLTFHKLSSCRLEAVSWQHCLKLFKSMMFKLEMTENFLW